LFTRLHITVDLLCFFFSFFSSNFYFR
jgi:hypothetical protein